MSRRLEFMSGAMLDRGVFETFVCNHAAGDRLVKEVVLFKGVPGQAVEVVESLLAHNLGHIDILD